jgi:uncharacterized Zn finger protein
MSHWEPDWETAPRIRPANGIRARSQRGAFGKTWWAGRWIAALERVVEGGRLERGRTYARQGQVTQLDLSAGLIEARVQGSRPQPYRVRIQVPVLADAEWDRIADLLARHALYAAQLLAGEMPQAVEDVFAQAGVSLFPSAARDLDSTCTCPDWANPCKHRAAVCYLVGERFDEDPFLMFELRGRDRQTILSALRERRAGADPTAVTQVEEPSDTASDEATEPVADDLAALERFWKLPETLSELEFHFEPPQVDAVPIKRLGAPPPGAGAEDIPTLLEADYRAISRAARRLALGDA